MPTADLPGMGASIRRGAAASARDRSFWSATIFLTATPAAGWSSYWVTAGPEFTPMTRAWTPKVESVLSITRTFRLISSCMRSRLALTLSSRVSEGRCQSICGGSSSGSASTRNAGGPGSSSAS